MRILETKQIICIRKEDLIWLYKETIIDRNAMKYRKEVTIVTQNRCTMYSIPEGVSSVV